MVLLALLSFALWCEGDRIALLPLVLLPVAVRSTAAVAVTCMKPMGHSQYAGVFDKKERWSTLCLPLICLLAACILPPVLTAGLQSLAPVAGAVGYGLAVLYASRQLGGVSGDVSGFALTVGELCGAAALALL